MDKASFAEFLGEVAKYPSVLTRLVARPPLGLAAAFHDQVMVNIDMNRL